MKLLQAGALLKEIPHKMLAMVGQVLLAIGSWCLSTAVQSGSVDRETSEGSMSGTTPRLAAMRAPGDQLPVRPTRGHQESQAGARGRAACPPEPAAYVRRADVPGWWDLKEVQQIPRGKDRWVQEGRWLIRVHGEPRRRSFHPVHRSCPVDLQRVQHSRATLVHPIDDPIWSNRSVHEDSWTSNHAWSRDYRWRGFTIFELKEEGVYPRQDATTYASGSYEGSREPDRSRGGYSGGPETFTPLLRPSEAMSSTPSAQSSLVVQAPLVQLSIHVAGSDVTVHRNSPPSEDDGSSDYELIP